MSKDVVAVIAVLASIIGWFASEVTSAKRWREDLVVDVLQKVSERVERLEVETTRLDVRLDNIERGSVQEGERTTP